MNEQVKKQPEVSVQFYKLLIKSIRYFKFYVTPFFFIYGIILLIQGKVSATDIYLFLTFLFIAVAGISLGHHRLETHRSFTPHPVIRFILLAFGGISISGPPSYWVALHLKHHAHADKDIDPHSPKHGFWHSHFLWMNKFDPTGLRDPYMKRFEGDKMLDFFDKTNLLWALLGAIIPYAIGGWSGFVWGFCIRVFVSSHINWLVNSYGHSFGSRNFNTKDTSTNNFWLALLTFGDGWHNNHHAFPNSAFHGLKWYEVDINKYIIIFLEKLGLVKDVKRVSKESIANRMATE